MASSSTASTHHKSFKYDVFLSFRGEDTRKNFVDHLYHALQEKSIQNYKDDDRINKGKRISDDLIGSIEDSKYFIIVFSKNYASSSWCLNELVKIMECHKTTCHKTTEHTAYPVFHDVEPTEVRKQSGAVGEAFAKHENDEAAEKWRETMKEAADLAGWELKNTRNGHQAKFIQTIVEEISIELRSINYCVDENLVGMETRITDIVSSLRSGSDDVHMIGIRGIGGGGKTTLARTVFNKISFQFEGKSFIENVIEVSKASLSGLKSLQNKVLSDLVNNKGINTGSEHEMNKMLRRIMCARKVLLVLDDVDHIDQLEALAGGYNWFKPGSIIIITTREKQVLVAHGVKLIYNVNLSSNKEAICLFGRYAFGRDIRKGYGKLSRQVVRYAAGLPLTVKVLGSFLCGKSKLEWVDSLDRLKTIPLVETRTKLEFSRYISQDDDYKEIFLNVATLLKGWLKDSVIEALESCGFHARIGLQVLEQKSLITIDDYDCVGMHNHLEEMAKNIVLRSHPDMPNKHSRFWDYKEIEYILAKNLGTEATRYMQLDWADLDPTITMKGLRNMKDLRFLDVSQDMFRYRDQEFNRNISNSPTLLVVLVNLCYNWKYYLLGATFPDDLRYLRWHDYPFTSLPQTFQANNLVALKMIDSRILELWEGGERKVLNNLRFLDLSYSLLKTFDLGLTPNLETLTLKGCTNLSELHISVECPRLRSLKISVPKLRAIDLQMTPNLENLDLNGHLVELYMPQECLMLRSLKLSSSNIRTLDLRVTPNLKKLDLNECNNLVELRAPIGCLKNIVYLDLSGCSRFTSFLLHIKHDTSYSTDESHEAGSLAELHFTPKICPVHLGNYLPKFQFTCFHKEDLPSLTRDLEKLISVGKGPCVCTKLETFRKSLVGYNVRKLKGSIPESSKRS